LQPNICRAPSAASHWSTILAFQVEAGEILAVVGPSGASKSSFLRLLNRLDEPTGGTVLLDGKDCKDIPSRELRRRVGMVMQMGHMACVIITHNREQAERIADRTMVIQTGKLVTIGPTREVLYAG
jgi:ABC-type methionine transport system ATPase subunit